MRRLLRSRLAWLGTMLALAGLALFMRDTTDPRIHPTGAIVGALLIVLGLAALAIAHRRTSRRPREA